MVLALVSISTFYSVHFTGMESGLSLLLIAWSCLCITKEKHVWVGAILGLAFANKLDGLAGFGAIGAWCLLTRDWRQLRALAIGFLVTSAPLLFAIKLGFGSILPNSATTKTFAHVREGGFDQLWMMKMLFTRWGLLAWPCTLAVVAGLFQKRSQLLFVISLWCVAHITAYSLIDLGADYPWYSAVPFYLAIVAAAHWVGTLASKIPSPSRRAKTPLGLVTIGLMIITPLGWAAASQALPHWRGLYSEGKPRSIPSNAKLDLARLSAGVWLAQRHTEDELLVCGFGLPALAYSGDVYDILGLNSVVDPTYALTAKYLIAHRNFDIAALAGILQPSAFFDFGQGQWVVYSTEASEVRTRGSRAGASVVTRLPGSPHPNGLGVDLPSGFLNQGSITIELNVPTAEPATLCPDLVVTSTREQDGFLVHTAQASLDSNGMPCLLHSEASSSEAFLSLGELPTRASYPVMYPRWSRFLGSYGFP